MGVRGTNTRLPCSHWGGMLPCGACAKLKLAGRPRAPLAPDCPNPSRAMRQERARWRYGCNCASCTERRGEFDARRSGGRPRGSVAVYQDVDEVAVDRAVTGDRPAQLNKAERMAVTARLAVRGATLAETARALGVDPRSVVRYRAELRTAS